MVICGWVGRRVSGGKALPTSNWHAYLFRKQAANTHAALSAHPAGSAGRRAALPPLQGLLFSLLDQGRLAFDQGSCDLVACAASFEVLEAAAGSDSKSLAAGACVAVKSFECREEFQMRAARREGRGCCWLGGRVGVAAARRWWARGWAYVWACCHCFLGSSCCTSIGEHQPADAYARTLCVSAPPRPLPARVAR